MNPRDAMERDLYATLGVPKDASGPEIKKAYRKLARELHPDKNPGDAKAEARFKEVSEANDILADSGKRKEYDEARSLFGSGAPRGPRPGPGGARTRQAPQGFDVSDLFGAGTAAGGQAGGNLGDVFGNLFGGGAARGRGPSRGTDLAASVTVDLASTLEAQEVNVRLPGGAPCPVCAGTGAAPGTAPVTCPTCHGVGSTTSNQGGFAFAQPCPTCRGAGQVIETPCPACRGTGTQERVQKIRIPAGIADGQKLRVRARGGPGERGGPNGDLEVTVRVRADGVFGRDGDALTLVLPVTFPEAALGTTVTVPTLDGSVRLKVPAGTTSGRKLRVKGRGFPVARRGGDRGPLLVTVEVAVPQKLSAKAKASLEEFAAENDETPRAELDRLLAQRAT